MYDVMSLFYRCFCMNTRRICRANSSFRCIDACLSFITSYHKDESFAGSSHVRHAMSLFHRRTAVLYCCTHHRQQLPTNGVDVLVYKTGVIRISYPNNWSMLTLHYSVLLYSESYQVPGTRYQARQQTNAGYQVYGNMAT